MYSPKTICTDQIASITYHQGIAALHGKQDKAKAEQLLQEALALATQVKRHEIVVLAHLGLAELYDETQSEKALAQNRLAVATVEALRANIMLPDDRAKLIAAQIRAYEQMVLRLIQQNDLVNAFCYAEMCKSRTLVELLEQKPLRKPKNVPQVWLDEQTLLREQLSQLYRPKQVDYEAIRPIEQKLDALRERIRLPDAEFASFKIVTPLPLGIIQQKLPAGAVLIEQFIVEEQLFSFVITQTTCRIVKLPLTYTQLRRQFKKIDGLNNDQLGMLSAVSRDYTQRLNAPWVLEKLYQVLINPYSICDPCRYYNCEKKSLRWWMSHKKRNRR